MPNDVQEIIQHFAEDVRKILGGLLDDVIRYDPYVRGGFFGVVKYIMRGTRKRERK